MASLRTGRPRWAKGGGVLESRTRFCQRRAAPASAGPSGPMPNPWLASRDSLMVYAPMGWLGLRAKAAGRLVFHSLSGRLLLLTLFYAMLTQVLIFVPSVARYHRNLLDNHIEAAEVAILPLTEVEKAQFSPGLQSKLVARAGAMAVMLKQPEKRVLFLPDELPAHIDVTIDLAKDNIFTESA